MLQCGAVFNLFIKMQHYYIETCLLDKLDIQVKAMKKEIIFLIPIVLFIVIAVIIIAFYNYKIKKQIIESGPIDENALKFLFSLSDLGSNVLKWGLIMLFGGVGLVVIEFLPYSAKESTLPFGIEAIFLALGFLVYFFIMKKEKL